MTFTLVGDFENDGMTKISINSPMGKCIRGKSIHFKGNYKVNDNIIYVEIIKIE